MDISSRILPNDKLTQPSILLYSSGESNRISMSKEIPTYGDCAACGKHFSEGEEIFKLQKLQRFPSLGAHPITVVEFTLEYCHKCLWSASENNTLTETEAQKIFDKLFPSERLADHRLDQWPI
jgi:hypothetical protein